MNWSKERRQVKREPKILLANLDIFNFAQELLGLFTKWFDSTTGIFMSLHSSSDKLYVRAPRKETSSLNEMPLDSGRIVQC